MNDRDELLWFTKTFSDIKGNDELAKSIGYNVSIDKIAEQLIIDWALLSDNYTFMVLNALLV